MLAQSVLSFGALLALATAQSAPGFPVSADKQLTVAYGNNTVSPAGERIPRGETAQPPTISSPQWPSSVTTAVLLMVDLDVPANNSRVQLIHWLAPNVTLSNATGSVIPLNIPIGAVPYLQPSPPVGDVPHAYTFIIFPQPADFSIPEQYADLAMNRVGFNTSRFLKDAGLSTAFAANWITVQNLTGAAATTYPAARPTATGGSGNASASPSAPASFPGAAATGHVGGLTVWAGVGAAVMAGVAALVL